MSTFEMGDASTPPSPPAPLPVFGFYIGGDTPHVWTDAEINALTSRYGLPIYTYSDPAADPHGAGEAIVNWLHQHGWATGTTVALDTESVAMPGNIAVIDTIVHNAGWRLMDYESKSPIADNGLTSGGRWVADWTDAPHLYPGSNATQYASATMNHFQWDSSVIDTAVPLHELHPPVIHPPTTTTVDLVLPVLVRGDTGPAVTRMQHLLLAHDPHALPTYGADGIWGAETAAAVAAFQRIYGVTADRGTTQEPTWHYLIEG